MAATPVWLIAGFGQAKTGLASSVIYNVYDANNVLKLGPVTGTMTEEADYAGTQNTGTYRVSVSADDGWTYPLRAAFTITGQEGVFAEATIVLSNTPPTPTTNIPVWLIASFGQVNSGLAASVIYNVYDANNALKLGPVVGEMTEEVDYNSVANTGTYRASASVSTAWVYPLRVAFTITGQAGLFAEETLVLSAGMVVTPSTTTPAGYPTVQNVTDFLTTAGFTVPSTMDIAGVILSTINDWEKRVGYHPFLADTTDVTVYFSPDDVIALANDYPMLNFSAANGPGGFISVTSVTTGVTQTNAGVLAVLNTDYVLREKNSPDWDRPYTRIEWIRAPLWGYRGIADQKDSIVVVGKRGYAATLDNQVFQAIMARVACKLMPQLFMTRTGGASLVDLGRQKFEFRNPLAGKGSLFDSWNETFMDAVRTFRKVYIP